MNLTALEQRIFDVVAERRHTSHSMIVDALLPMMVKCQIAERDHLGDCRHQRHGPEADAAKDAVRKAIRRLVDRRLLYGTSGGWLVPYSRNVHVQDLMCREQCLREELASVVAKERKLRSRIDRIAQELTTLTLNEAQCS